MLLDKNTTLMIFYGGGSALKINKSKLERLTNLISIDMTKILIKIKIMVLFSIGLTESRTESSSP